MFTQITNPLKLGLQGFFHKITTIVYNFLHIAMWISQKNTNSEISTFPTVM